MTATPEFLFDVGSPNAFLVHRALPAIAARTGLRFRYVPVLLGGVFKATGNRSPVMAFAGVRGKLAYERREMERFIARHGITGFAMNPHFPVNTLAAMRLAVAAGRLGIAEAYVEAAFAAMWRDGRRFDDPDTIRAVLEEAALPADDLLALAGDPTVKQELAASTEQAVERGAFGAPTFFVGEEMWFGKERLGDVVEAALAT